MAYARRSPDAGQWAGADIFLYRKRLLDACSWLSEILAKFHMVVKGKAAVDVFGCDYTCRRVRFGVPLCGICHAWGFCVAV